MRRSLEPFASADPPEVVEIRTVRVAAGKTHFIRSLAEEYGGIMTHFEQGRSKYCDPQYCWPKCRAKGRYYKGYFAAQVWVEKWDCWYPVVCELPEKAELDVRQQFRRGLIWEFSRAADRRSSKSPVRAVLKEEQDPHNWPLAFDIAPSLLHLYHLEEIDLTAENPLPPLPTALMSPGGEKSPSAKPQEATPEEMANFMQQLRGGGGIFKDVNGHSVESD
jgi:hypothetical protein